MGRVRGGRRQSRDAWCSAVGRGYLGGTGRDETGRPSVGPWSADSTASTRGWRAEGTRVLTEGGGSQLRLEARASAPLGSLGANQAITIGTFYAPSFPRACTRGLPEIPCHVCGRPEFGGTAGWDVRWKEAKFRLGVGVNLEVVDEAKPYQDVLGNRGAQSKSRTRSGASCSVASSGVK